MTNPTKESAIERVFTCYASRGEGHKRIALLEQARAELAAKDAELAELRAKLEQQKVEMALAYARVKTIGMAGEFGENTQIVTRIRELEYTDLQSRQYIQNAQEREHRINELEAKLQPLACGHLAVDWVKGYSALCADESPDFTGLKISGYCRRCRELEQAYAKGRRETWQNANVKGQQNI